MELLLTIVLLTSGLEFSSAEDSVFISEDEANIFFHHRVQRSNRGFVLEEFSPGNQERECVEEICNYEEAFEISDNRPIANKFWKKYTGCKQGQMMKNRKRKRHSQTSDKVYLRSCLADIDQCARRPCSALYTIKCVDLINDYNCICKKGYGGKNCGKDIDLCDPNPCSLEGTNKCINSLESYNCDCKDNFVGLHCETATNHCTPEPCSPTGTSRCVDLPDGFRCDCLPGYSGSICEDDLNECLSNPCGDHGSCRDNLNNFTCLCDEHYFGVVCDQVISDCRRFGCSGHGRCLAAEVDNVHYCDCYIGYEGASCEMDTDECASSPCHHNCTNTVGSFRCGCLPGYLLDLESQIICEDINECTNTAHGCDYQCVNTAGSSYCLCQPGYKVDRLFGKYCEDINECKQDNGGCSGKCLNDDGSFSCVCHKGYETDDGGRTCTDIDECAGPHRCQHICKNTPGSYVCTCPEGFVANYDKVSCRDINECILPDPPCGQTCQNTDGSFTCSCRRGFLLQSETNACDDIDECASNNGGCRQLCVNTAGSFSCACNRGYELVGRRCFDIRECSSNPCVHGRCNEGLNNFTCSCYYGYSGQFCELENNPCSEDPCANGVCTTTADSFTCECNLGFTGEICNEDVDECLAENGNCPHLCVNNQGSYTCQCRMGYILNDNECEDVNECEDTNICEQECQNTLGSYTCGCSTGYQIRNNGSCMDIDECADEECEQTCQNSQGSFRCLCLDGFVLNSNGRTCADIDECLSQGTCEDKCFNTEGSYTCGCSRGYSLAEDGRTCQADSGCLGSRPDPAILRWHLLLGGKSNDFANQQIVKQSRKKINLYMLFRTFDTEGLLLGISNEDGDKYIYIMIQDGQLTAGYNTGSRHVSMASNTTVSNGAWHSVRLLKTGKKLKFFVNNTTVARVTSSSPSAPKFQPETLIYIGGLPGNHSLLRTIGIYPQYIGCVRKIRTKMGKVSWIPSKNGFFNSHKGCTETVQPGTLFYGTGFLQLDPSQMRRVPDFKFRAVVRTSYPDGVLVSARTNGGGKLVLSLSDGTIRAEVTDISGIRTHSSIYRKEGQLMCTGLWMSIYCKISTRGKISLYVDGRPGSEEMRGGRFRFDSAAPLYIGGEPGGTLAPFNGNMRKVYINDRVVDLATSTNYFGVNARSMPAVLP
uniref:Uncharacterized protein n=1 Tax=Ciona intestinalis TaxID=7719 RepID=H2XYP0_CIOIN